MSDDQDLSDPYMQHRADFAQDTAAVELLNRVQGKKATEEPAPGESKPEGPTSDQMATEGPSAMRATPETRARGQAIVDDVSRGTTEVPRAIVKGTRDAVANAVGLLDDVANFMDRATGLPEGSFPAVPDIDAPKTTTGKLVAGVTQFLVGFKGVGTALKGIGLASKGATWATIKGALASFVALDPQQEKLSNLIQENPELANPVTEFLSSKPDDTDAEGRFKNAIEGLGLGAATEGFFKAVGALRAANAAKQTVADAAAKAPKEVQRMELPEDSFQQLGDTAQGSTGIKSVQRGEASTDETYINFARIDGPEDVKAVMQKLADSGAPAADEARAGVETFEKVKLDAAHQDAWKALKARRAGEPLNASQAVAARQLWAQTTAKLTEVAEQAALNPSESNLFAFRKMLDVQDMVQREVLGARASTARALASWRIPVSTSGAQRLNEVAAALQGAGGSEVTRELAQRVTSLARAGEIQALTRVAEKGAYATTRDAIIEVWINGLLSSPVTHAVNTISNTSVVSLRMVERGTASAISRLLGTQGGVAAGEAAAQFSGMTQGTKEMFSYYSKLARLQSAENPAEAQSLRGSKLEIQPSISSDSFKISGDTPLGRSVDLAGQLVRTPGAALQAEDDFFKTIGYRMELNAQAVRQATADVNAGRITEDGFKARVAEIVENPPENVKLDAIDAATYQTFTNQAGAFAKALSTLTSKFPVLKIIVPFTRTPANILRFTFERSPLAPLMSQFRANIAAGGARKDLALAQMALGSSAMLAFADMTMSGSVTGRGPVENGQRQALQREGWTPYSAKIGDRWVPYNRFDPVGSLMGMSADLTEMLMQSQQELLNGEESEGLGAAAAIAFAGNLTNKTYLSGLSSVVEALNDPTRYAGSYLERLAGSTVPAVVAGAERAGDPYVREVNSMTDAIRARLPGASDSLPPARTLWGEPRTTASGLGTEVDFFLPPMGQQPSGEPIDAEIIRLGANVTMPSRIVSFNGASVDLAKFPGAYSRYVELAGNAAKDPAFNLGAKDYLNKLVSGKSPLSITYKIRSDGPEGQKATLIKSVINDYRELARKQLLHENPELSAKVAKLQMAQRRMRLPITGTEGLQ